MYIRNFRHDDIGSVTSIYGHHVLHGSASFETEPPSEQEMLARFIRLEDRQFPILVAEDETGLVCGYAYAGPHKDRQAYQYTVEDSIYIHPDFTSRGIGSSLLSELLIRSQQRGYRQMIAVIGDSENRASISLHLKAGFFMIGTARELGFKHGRFIDVVFMQKTI